MAFWSFIARFSMRPTWLWAGLAAAGAGALVLVVTTGWMLEVLLVTVAVVLMVALVALVVLMVLMVLMAVMGCWVPSGLAAGQGRLV